MAEAGRDDTEALLAMLAEAVNGRPVVSLPGDAWDAILLARSGVSREFSTVTADDITKSRGG